MAAAGVPTASWAAVDDVEAGMAAIERYPVVLKFDGLAAGKGVVIAADEVEARATLTDFLVARRFGAGQVVVEECLVGEELSLLALCDGERAVAMAPAQDYKRIFDGDLGPNTGGMGSYSPVPGVSPERAEELCALVHQPVVDLLRERGTPFHGVLYAGIMLTEDGPKVLEYNVRFGDPETQAVLPRLTSDLLSVLRAAANPGGLDGVALQFSDDWAVTVVLASAGYPASASSGDVISGLDAVPASVEVTHAGTARREDGAIVTAGGRVLSVTALGATAAAARADAYSAARAIEFDGRQLREDIALRAVQRTKPVLRSGRQDREAQHPRRPRLSDVERDERNGRPAKALRGRQMQRVQRPGTGELGDVRRHGARDLVELDDPEGCEVIHEGGLRRGGITFVEQAGEIATDLDERVTRGQERGVARKQRIGDVGVGFVDVALEQGARVHIEAHSPRSSDRTSSTRLRALQRRSSGSSSPLPGVIQPSATPSPILARPGNGPSKALGRPRSVTRNVSPRAASSRYSESRCLSSRTPTSAMWTH